VVLEGLCWRPSAPADCLPGFRDRRQPQRLAIGARFTAMRCTEAYRPTPPASHAPQLAVKWLTSPDGSPVIASPIVVHNATLAENLVL
jgi:hypothetical protein